MGYTVKYGPRVEHMAVRHKDAQRNIRIDQLDPRFFETALREYYRQLHRMPTEMQQGHWQEKRPGKLSEMGKFIANCPLCGGIRCCRAPGIPRCPALWLATITTAPCCGKPTTATALLLLLREDFCSARCTSSLKQNFTMGKPY